MYLVYERPRFEPPFHLYWTRDTGLLTLSPNTLSPGYLDRWNLFYGIRKLASRVSPKRESTAIQNENLQYILDSGKVFFLSSTKKFRIAFKFHSKSLTQIKH